MSGLRDLLNSSQGQQIISGLARETGQPESKTADLLGMAMPLLLGAMKKNVGDPASAEGLMNALSDKHNGSILEDLGSLFSGGVNREVVDDGAGILNHVLGKKQPMVENALSQKSGLDAGTVAQILKIAAPIVMGFLGKQKAQNKVGDTDSLNTLLGSMLGGQPQQNQNLIMSLIDTDGDGSVLDDVADMVIGSNKKKSGIGGLLGRFFR
jgi:hypothetical protein